MSTDKIEELVQSMPVVPGDKMVVLAMTQQEASAVRTTITKLRGALYNQHVECRAASGVHEWGAGLWSDQVFIHHSVWERMSDLPMKDQEFILMLATPIKIGTFFGVKPDAPKKEGFFSSIRRKVASWIMPS